MRESQELQVQSLGQEDGPEEGKAIIPLFLPGESHEQMSPAGYSRKESDTTEVT